MERLIHILHLEDNPADAELVQAELKSAGLACQTSRVQARDEFDEALRQGAHDVILADYQLPMYDGMSALRLAREVCSDVPFIFVSGTMGEDAAIEGLTEGATDYVLKQKLSRLAPAVRRALHDAENRLERKRADEQLRALLREKDVLLAEVHHRVKNNMQVIISLLELQARSIQDERALAAFRESRNRVSSMALVHELLYRSQDFAQIDMAQYIRSLTTKLLHLYGVDSSVVTLQMAVEAVSLDLEKAIPCGLVINELVTNCLKHAFPEGRPGQINIQVRRDDCHVVLVVGDDGVGFPKELNWQNATSLGLRLITFLTTHDLGGGVELDQANGTEFKITFPAPACKPQDI